MTYTERIQQCIQFAMNNQNVKNLIDAREQDKGTYILSINSKIKNWNTANNGDFQMQVEVIFDFIDLQGNRREDIDVLIEWNEPRQSKQKMKVLNINVN